MNHSLLIVVFYDDLPNFKIFCYLLNKFWQGNKKIKIIYSKSTKIPKELIDKNILDEISKTTKLFLTNWDIEIIKGLKTKLRLWYEQQWYKVLFSSFDNEDYTIVFDCKNFISSPMNVDDFIENNDILYIESDVDKFTKYCVEYFNTTLESNISMITPNIWKNNEVLAYKEYLIKKSGLAENWFIFPCEADYIGYYFFKKHVLKHNNFKKASHKVGFVSKIKKHHRTRQFKDINLTAIWLKELNLDLIYIEEWIENSTKIYNILQKYNLILNNK